jgi:hypothetical protein
LHQILFTWTKLRIARRCESQRDSRMRHSHNPRQTSASHESRERAAYDRRAALSEGMKAAVRIIRHPSGRQDRYHRLRFWKKIQKQTAHKYADRRTELMVSLSCSS